MSDNMLELYESAGVDVPALIEKNRLYAAELRNKIDGKDSRVGLFREVLLSMSTLGYIPPPMLDDLMSYSNEVVSEKMLLAVLELNSGLYSDTTYPNVGDIWLSFPKRSDMRNCLDVKKNVNVDKQFMTHFKRCKKHRRWYLGKLHSARSRVDLKYLNDIFPFSSAGDKSHTKIDLASFIFALVHQPKIYNTQLLLTILRLCPFGTYNALVLGLTIAAHNNTAFAQFVHYLHKSDYCCLSSTDIIVVLKAFSDRVRKTFSSPMTGPLSVVDVSMCSYWHMCSTRQLNTSNWVQERRNRQTTTALRPVLGHDFLHYVEMAVSDIISELFRDISFSDYCKGWEDYVKNRQRYVTAGSTGGVKTKLGNSNISVGKRVFFENISKEDVTSWLDDTPIMIASASEKYELAKARAIYGTQPKDYIIMAYILSPLEDALSRRLDVDYALDGLGVASRMTKRLQNLAEKCPWAAMLDYKDFNIQHTLELQSLVFREIARMASTSGLGLDYVRAANWCAAAFLNCWISFPSFEQLFKCKQGLFSGMRGTSFVNTVLNISYHRAGVIVTRRLFPKLSPIIHATHQGDDLWLCSSSRAWNIFYYHVMSASGLVFEPSKQLFSYGVGEFLRVLYSEHRVYGYLGRSMASLIISPLQGKACDEKISSLRELDAQIKTLVRRGLSKDLSLLLWHSIVEYRAIKSSKDVDDSISYRHLTRHSMCGGVGCSPPFQRTHIGIRGSVPTMPLFTSELIDISASHMSSDLYTAFHETLPDSADALKTVNALHKQNLAGILTKGDLSRYRKNMRDTYTRWRNKIDEKDVSNIEWNMEYIFSTTVAYFFDKIRTQAIIHNSVRESVYAIESGTNLPQSNNRCLASLLTDVLVETPFSHISELRVAFNCSTVDAVYHIKDLLVHMGLSYKVLGYLKAFIDCCTKDVVNFWLEHCLQMPNHLADSYNPTIMSEVYTRIICDIEQVVQQLTINKVSDARNILLGAQLVLEEELKNYEILAYLSKF